MVDVIHIHEDDWGMRNLYPLAAYDEAAREIATAEAASERNRDPSGFGWTAMHEIKEPSLTYADVGLRLADAAAALAPIMPRVKRFNATIFSAMGSDRCDPMGSYEDDAWAFGRGPQCYVKLDTRGDLVSHIWFGLESDDAGDADALRRCLVAIDVLAPSVVADFFLDAVGRVDDPEFLDRYFEVHRETREAANEAVLAYRHSIAAPEPPSLLRKLAMLFGRRR